MIIEEKIPSGFKPSPLGPIPDEWQIITLGTLVEIISGTSPSLYSLKSFGKYPYLKVEDLNNCEKYQTRSREYSDNEMNIVPENSIIFPKRGAAILNNKVRINTIPVQMDSNLMAIYPRSSTLNNEYLYYRIITEQLHKIADTSTIPQINNKHIIPYKFPLPPLLEQTAIANCLSVWDNAIQKTQALIRQKELRKKWLMQQLLSGKKRLPGFEKTKWILNSLDKFIEPVTRGVPKPNETYTGIGIRSHGKGTFLKFNEQPEKNSMDQFFVVRPNDLIVNITFAWEQAIAIVKPEDDGALASHRFPTFIFKKEIGYADFFRFFILLPRVKYMLDLISPGGAGRNRVMSKPGFLGLEFLFPGYEEQTAIARVLQVADNETALLKTKLEKLREQKKGLMQVLLTGKKRLKVTG